MVVFPPLPAFLAESMCVWEAPRFLGPLAFGFVFASSFTVLLLVAATATANYFAITGVYYRKTKGEAPRRLSSALACLGLFVLTIAA